MLSPFTPLGRIMSFKSELVSAFSLAQGQESVQVPTGFERRGRRRSLVRWQPQLRHVGVPLWLAESRSGLLGQQFSSLALNSLACRGEIHKDRKSSSLLSSKVVSNFPSTLDFISGTDTNDLVAPAGRHSGPNSSLAFATKFQRHFTSIEPMERPQVGLPALGAIHGRYSP